MVVSTWNLKQQLIRETAGECVRECVTSAGAVVGADVALV